MGFLMDGLLRLDFELRKRGNHLILREGKPAAVLACLREKLGAGDIFAEEDCSPYARSRDESVKRGLPLKVVQGVTIQPMELLRKADGSPYTHFTPFSKMWHRLPFPGKPIPAPDWIPGQSHEEGLPIVDCRQSFPASIRAGEVEAQRRLESFTKINIQRYAEERSRLDLAGTSSLSPYLRFGMLSARQAAWAAREADELAKDATSRQGAETWLNELAWMTCVASSQC
jgi:deoxyribodipyrimidine photo-lyase